MSNVTGDVTTCPRASDIFFCKYCESDSICGQQVLEMTEEERQTHYKKIDIEFEKWQQRHFPHRSSLGKGGG